MIWWEILGGKEIGRRYINGGEIGEGNEWIDVRIEGGTVFLGAQFFG